MKGWHRDNYRHSLAARGYRVSMKRRPDISVLKPRVFMGFDFSHDVPVPLFKDVPRYGRNPNEVKLRKMAKAEFIVDKKAKKDAANFFKGCLTPEYEQCKGYKKYPDVEANFRAMMDNPVWNSNKYVRLDPYEGDLLKYDMDDLQLCAYDDYVSDYDKPEYDWRDEYDWVMENGKEVGYLKPQFQENPWHPYEGAAEAYEASIENDDQLPDNKGDKN